MDGVHRHPLLEHNEHRLAEAATPARRAQLLIARAEMLARFGAIDEARDVTQTAAALLALLRKETAPPDDRAAISLAIDLKRTQATIDYFAGRVPQSIRALRSAIEMATATALVVPRAQCLATLALHLLGDGHDIEAIDPASEALRTAGSLDATTQFRALLALSKVALAHGLQDLAAPLFAEMLVAARSLDDPLAEAAAFERMTMAHCESARVAYLRGCLDQKTLDHSIAAVRDNIAQAERAGSRGMHAVNQCRLAQLLALRGEHSTALSLLEHALPQLQPIPTVQLPARADLAAMLAECKCVKEAMAQARDAISALDTSLPPLCRAYVLMRCANILSLSGTSESGRCRVASHAALRQFEEHRRRVRERLQAPLSDPQLGMPLGVPAQFGALGHASIGAMARE